MLKPDVKAGPLGSAFLLARAVMRLCRPLPSAKGAGGGDDLASGIIKEAALVMVRLPGAARYEE